MAEEKYVSGEEHRAMSRSQSSSGKQVSISGRTVGLIIGAVILCGVSFAAGISYQKGQKTTLSPIASSTFGGGSNGAGGGYGGGGGYRNGGGFGQVTAISSSSISLQNPRTGTTNTYSITGSTTITDTGQTVTTSDIQVGSVAFVRVASSGSTVATSITVNPTAGGGSGTTTNPTTQ